MFSRLLPVGIDAVAAVIAGLALAAGDVVTVNNRADFAIGTVYNTLAYRCRKAGEEGCFGSLYIHFTTFSIETVLAKGDVLL